MSSRAASAGWPLSTSPYHAGERAVQSRAGAREFAERAGRHVIRDHMPEQHRSFFEQLSSLFVGAVDADGRSWATAVFGPPGFVRSPDARHLRIAAAADDDDPALASLGVGAPVALVGVEFHTRRRNRLNGRVVARDAGSITLEVTQSFGNCPQYIQARSPLATARAAPPAGTPEAARLSPAAAALVARADTFFVASASPQARTSTDPTEGADVNHRGGRPGFVHVEHDAAGTVLTWPDFVGNSAFNTLGNLALNPQAGLLFIDFESGDALTLTGQAETVWDGEALAAFAGAQRLVRFRVERGRLRPGLAPARWSAPDFAPQLEPTGTWADVAASAAAAAGTRAFVVARIDRESDTVKSFWLHPADGLGTAPHLPGQFLPIAAPVDGRTLRRTYTITSPPGGPGYRISVKRLARDDGTAASMSRWLHDHARVGTPVSVRAPQGRFVPDALSRRAVLLLSAGIGITPMIAMVDALASAHTERPAAPDRPLHFVHFVHDGADHAFAPHLRQLAARRANVRLFTAYARPRAQDRAGEDFDVAGGIDRALLRSRLPLDDYDVYLCGPPGFMQAAYDILRSLGVPDARIQAEAFGPASLRRGDAADPSPAAAPPTTSPAPAAAVEHALVRFARSGTSATWRPADGTLLELAEANGVEVAWGCRSGSCGTCRCAVRSGDVVHDARVTAPVTPGRALVCSARPASDEIVLDL